MTIFALFMCLQGHCTLQGGTRMTGDGLMPMTIYDSLEKCQEYATHYVGGRAPDKDGHMLIMGNPAQWFECRSKHVETWEPAH